MNYLDQHHYQTMVPVKNWGFCEWVLVDTEATEPCRGLALHEQGHWLTKVDSKRSSNLNLMQCKHFDKFEVRSAQLCWSLYLQQYIEGSGRINCDDALTGRNSLYQQSWRLGLTLLEARFDLTKDRRMLAALVVRVRLEGVSKTNILIYSLKSITKG